MGYKILGYVVWKGLGVVLRRKGPSRRTFALAVVALAVVGLAVAGAKRETTSS